VEPVLVQKDHLYIMKIVLSTKKIETLIHSSTYQKQLPFAPKLTGIHVINFIILLHKIFTFNVMAWGSLAISDWLA